MKIIVFLISCFFLINVTKAQQVVPLYPDSIPNSIGKLSKDQLPTLEIFLPSKVKADGIFVLVIPGGAYGFLALKEEGLDIAKVFNEMGIAAAVLKYRLPSDNTMKNKTIGPLQDAQQAIKIIRTKAREWNLNPEKVGVIGFSAGGHLASTLSTKFNTPVISNNENINLRPDFMVLMYPVISMEAKLTNAISRQNLLGIKPSENQVWLFSNEKQVSFDTPPTYITHTGDDQIVDVNNSIEMYKALVNNNIPAEMHLFPKGNHGFIQRLPVNEWLDPMLTWLQRGGFYTKPVSK